MYINTIKISNLFYSPTNLTIYAFEYSNHNLFNYSLYSIELNPNVYNSYIAFVFIFDNKTRHNNNTACYIRQKSNNFSNVCLTSEMQFVCNWCTRICHIFFMFLLLNLMDRTILKIEKVISCCTTLNTLQ